MTPNFNFAIKINATGELRTGDLVWDVEVAMHIFRRVWDSLGFGEQFDGADYEYEYDEADYSPDDALQDEMMLNRERSAPANVPPSNVIGMPNRNGGRSEMVLLQPRSFEEMPQVITLLRERKSVIVNLILMDPDQAQRSVDFVAGGVYAIDGHQERLGENIFLFTPSVVQISSYSPVAAAPPVRAPLPSPPSISPTITTSIAHPPEGQYRAQ
ncbi:cell division protein SepF [Pantanalinema sp. GBBB05]|uniref:cell division protein SepF n=1 Tax=Pantanalinema sp. GBBB05 TaxID=2604139 RepID=UPI003D814EB4